MFNCPSCNTANPVGAQFCVGCGAPLAEPPRPSDSVACPSCGTPNPPHAQFCIKCGAPLAAESPAAAPAFMPAPSSSAPDSVWSLPSMPPQATAAKQRSLALTLEIIPACFGIFGIGWFYGGDNTAGLFWLVGMLVWESIALGVSLVTAGLGCLCFIPLNLAAVAVSAALLNTYINQHPDLFSA